MPNINEAESDLADAVRSFVRKFNREGFGFQHALLKKIGDLAKSNDWLFEVEEFPVTTQGRDSKIDFILRPLGTRFFLVAETKRVNPAYSRWCFARSNYVHRDYDSLRQPIQVERVTAAGHEPGFRVEGAVAGHSQKVYNLGFVVKAKGKGDSGGSGDNDAIEKAVSQAFRGSNGLVAELARSIRRTSQPAREIVRKRDATIMPALFTTSRLYVTDDNIDQANLLTGEVSADQISLRPVPYLYLQYPVSQGVSHGHATIENPKEFSDRQRVERLRTIPIVNASGVEEFFDTFNFYNSHQKIEYFDWD